MKQTTSILCRAPGGIISWPDVSQQTTFVITCYYFFVKCLLILPLKMIYFLFCGFVNAELIKLAKMASVMHEADHAYSILSTW